MGLFVLLFARSRLPSVPSSLFAVQLSLFRSKFRLAESSRLVHQQNYYQALIKIYNAL